MAPHSSTLAWPIPWTGRSLVGCSPWGREESDTSERLHFRFSLSCIGEGNGNPLQCSCGRIPGTGEPGGLPSVGSHRVGHNWGDLAVAVAATLITEVILFSLKSLKRINFTLSVKCFLKKRKTADPKKAERKHWKEDRKFRFENLHYLSLNSQEVKQKYQIQIEFSTKKIHWDTFKLTVQLKSFRVHIYTRV